MFNMIIFIFFLIFYISFIFVVYRLREIENLVSFEPIKQNGVNLVGPFAHVSSVLGASPFMEKTKGKFKMHMGMMAVNVLGNFMEAITEVLKGKSGVYREHVNAIEIRTPKHKEFANFMSMYFPKTENLELLALDVNTSFEVKSKECDKKFKKIVYITLNPGSRSKTSKNACFITASTLSMGLSLQSIVVVNSYFDHVLTNNSNEFLVTLRIKTE